MASYLSNWAGSFLNPTTTSLFSNFANDLQTAANWVYETPEIDKTSLSRTSTIASGSFISGGSFEMSGSGFSTPTWTVNHFAVHAPDSWDYSFNGSMKVNAITGNASGSINHFQIKQQAGGQLDIYGRSLSNSNDASIARITYQFADGTIELKGSLIYHGLNNTITGKLTSFAYADTSNPNHSYQITGLSYTLDQFDSFNDFDAFVAAMMAGGDLINGTADAHILRGFAGNDIYIIDHVDDEIVENADEGTDLAKINIALANGAYTLAANLEDAILINTVAFKLSGNSLDNQLTGNAAANTLEGGEGNDKLDGGKGADTLKGGLGNDIYVVDNAGDVVDETDGSGNDAGGTDEVIASINYQLGDNLENLTLTGVVALNGTGNALNNVITGNSAANILDGGEAGDDTLKGGKGNDTYIVNSSTVLVQETDDASGGTDLVKSSVSFTLGDYLENLTLTGGGDINGTGNDKNNLIIGNASANILSGGDGNDTMIGGDGNDTLDGGTGNDTMTGGNGNDLYILDNANDKVSENNAILASGGMDEVQSSISYTLGANLENLTLTGSDDIDGTGNTLANILTGNGGNNILNGGGGIDSYAGGDGNDTYMLDREEELANITENVNNGTDDLLKITYANSSKITAKIVDLTLANLQNIENILISGKGLFNLTGNVLDNILTGNAAANILEGGNGNDILNGGAGKDTVNGGDGNDELNGGAGGDSMIGGLGNDIYFVDNIADTVDETGDTLGTDEVRASINYTLVDNFENLTLIGTAALTGTGNDLDNVITGNNGNNILDGGLGNDTLAGGLGADLLFGGWGADSLDGGAGNDIYLFRTPLEHSQAEIHDSIGAADEVRFDGANLDTLTLYAGDAGIERVVIGTGIGATADTSGTKALDIIASDVGNALTIIGNAGDNQLFGTGFNDQISGGSGNDVLSGDGGNDRLTGGAGSDIFLISSKNGVDADTILDFKPGVDRIHLDPSIFFDLATTLDLNHDALEGLNAEAFYIGTQANNASPMIIYDAVKGALYYDADGSGQGEQVQIAIIGIGSHPSLSYADFRVDWWA